MANGQANEQHDFLVDLGLLEEENGGVRILSLNRPNKLNCITVPMVDRLCELFEKWESDEEVKLILLKGIGRAFCAGGDLGMFYHFGKEEGGHCRKVVYKKFWLDFHLYSLKKPMVALLNGLVMGGGAGLSVPAQFRVVTEKTTFSMPEASIGYHTDVAASYFLSHLPGYFGDYMAITGARIDAADMVHSGLATHFVPSEKLPELEQHLLELNSSDVKAIHEAIEEFSTDIQLSEKSLLRRREIIDKIYCKESVEEILEALIAENASEHVDWSKDIAKIKRSSPTGIKVTFRSVRSGRTESLAQCLRKEFRLTIRTLASLISGDLYEGIRATVVAKDNSPKWNPSSLLEVTLEKLDLMFSPFEDSTQELQLPDGDNLPRWSGKYKG